MQLNQFQGHLLDKEMILCLYEKLITVKYLKIVFIRTILNKELTSLPNSKITIEKKPSLAEPKTFSLKYSFQIENLEQDEYQLFDQEFKEKIEEEVKILILK